MALAADPARDRPPHAAAASLRMPIVKCGPNEGSPLAAITRRQAAGAAGATRAGCRRSTSRCATEIRAWRGAVERWWQRVAPHPRRAALSAILRGDDRERQRCVVCGAGSDAHGSRRCGRCRLITTIPLYIEALKRQPRAASSQALDFEPQRLLLSFHGMPQRTLELGDPYHCHCQKTARLLGEALGRPVDIAFQSRFGRAKWLEPATDAVLTAYPGQGVTSASPSPRPVFRPIVWRLWKSSASAAATNFLLLAERISRGSIASTIQPRAWRCSKRLVRRELEGWRPAT